MNTCHSKRSPQRDTSDSKIHYRSLSSGDDADCVVRSGQHNFLVHKLVLKQCNFFAAAFKHGWLEAKDSVVELQEDEPYLVARLIIWLYQSEYPCDDVNGSKVAQEHLMRISDPLCVSGDASHTPDWSSLCRLHLQMATMGDKYGLPDLVKEGFRCFVKDFSCKDETGTLSASNAHTYHPLSIPDSRRLDLLQSCCEAPGSCDTFFRTYALSLLQDWTAWDGASSIRVEKLVRDCPDIAVNLATSRMSTKTWYCSSCDWETRVLLRRCACSKKKKTGCKEEGCVDAIREENICRRCHEFGTLNPPSKWP